MEFAYASEVGPLRQTGSGTAASAAAALLRQVPQTVFERRGHDRSHPMMKLVGPGLTYAMTLGLNGIVTDARVRDIAELRELSSRQD